VKKNEKVLYFLFIFSQNSKKTQKTETYSRYNCLNSSYFLPANRDNNETKYTKKAKNQKYN